MDTHTKNGNILAIFDKRWQAAVTGHMLTSRNFFLKCKNLIDYAWFEDEFIKAIVKVLYEFYDRHRYLPLSLMEIQSLFYSLYPNDNERQTKYSAKLLECQACSKAIHLDTIREQMTTWIKIAKYRNGIEQCVSIFNSRQYDKAVDFLGVISKELSNATFEDDETVGFHDGIDFLEQASLDRKNCVTMGHPDFDEILLRGARINVEENGKKDVNTINRHKDLAKRTTGGLILGDTTILLGASNAGKTTSVVTIICANIRMGKDVLFITHEQQPRDIKLKLMQNMTGLTSEELANVKKSKEAMEKVKEAGEILEKHLTYISWMKSGKMTCERVIILIKQRQEIIKSEKGKGFDLVVDDYPGKLQSEYHSQKKSSDSYDEKRYIYSEFSLCAREENFHIVLPVQTNRQGFKTNRGGTSGPVDQGDIAESFGIAQDADNVISINRSKDDIAMNIIRYFVSKSRSSSTGNFFVSHTKFEISCSLSLSYPSLVHHESEVMPVDMMATISQGEFSDAISSDPRLTAIRTTPPALPSEIINKTEVAPGKPALPPMKGIPFINSTTKTEV